jgi:hypothetical protein
MQYSTFTLSIIRFALVLIIFITGMMSMTRPANDLTGYSFLVYQHHEDSAVNGFVDIACESGEADVQRILVFHRLIDCSLVEYGPRFFAIANRCSGVITQPPRC